MFKWFWTIFSLSAPVYTRVVDVSEVERVSVANEWDFWLKKQRVGITKYRTKHFTCGLVFIVYTETFIILVALLF